MLCSLSFLKLTPHLWVLLMSVQTHSSRKPFYRQFTPVVYIRVCHSWVGTQMCLRLFSSWINGLLNLFYNRWAFFLNTLNQWTLLSEIIWFRCRLSTEEESGFACSESLHRGKLLTSLERCLNLVFMFGRTKRFQSN